MGKRDNKKIFRNVKVGVGILLMKKWEKEIIKKSFEM